MQLGAMSGNCMVYPLKFGERSGLLRPCQSRAKPFSVWRAEGVETGWAVPKGSHTQGKGTVQTTNICGADGGENRSGMNPGAVGSNPAADIPLI